MKLRTLTACASVLLIGAIGVASAGLLPGWWGASKPINTIAPLPRPESIMLDFRFDSPGGVLTNYGYLAVTATNPTVENRGSYSASYGGMIEFDGVNDSYEFTAALPTFSNCTIVLQGQFITNTSAYAVYFDGGSVGGGTRDLIGILNNPGTAVYQLQSIAQNTTATIVPGSWLSTDFQYNSNNVEMIGFTVGTTGTINWMSMYTNGLIADQIGTGTRYVVTNNFAFIMDQLATLSKLRFGGNSVVGWSKIRMTRFYLYDVELTSNEMFSVWQHGTQKP